MKRDPDGSSPGPPLSRRAAAPERLVARGQLPVRGPDLPAGQPAAARAAGIGHVKPRLLGHWGTTPGLNFVYAHLNRVIRAATSTRSTSPGPATAGPGLVANTYLEGTYTEIYPA